MKFNPEVCHFGCTIRRTLTALILGALASVPASAAPPFNGLKEALPAPGAAVLRWDRSPKDNMTGSVTYVIYQKEGDSAKIVKEVSADEWTLLDLQPGKEYSFIVRAKDESGEDKNANAKSVRPTSTVPVEEWRAVWVNRFEWVGGATAQIRSRVAEMMRTVAASNMNVVVLQVRGQGDTLYPSPNEPWSDLVDSSARGGDPLAIAVEEAKKNGVQLHAWVNLSTIWQSGSKQLPSNRSHPFFKFADASHPEHCLGLIHDGTGKPKQWGSDGYVWLTTGNPEVNAYLRQQVEYLVNKYDIDGINLDDRTALPEGASKDPVSVRRFAGRGNPSHIGDLRAWQLDQLSRFISDVCVQIKAKDMRLMLTVGPFGIVDSNRIEGYRGFGDCRKFGIEPEELMKLGVVDALMPQIYWGPEDGTRRSPNFGPVLRDWVSHNRTGRPIWPGSTIRSNDKQPLEPVQRMYVAETRALGLNGLQIYSYTGAPSAQWIAFGKKTYPNKARVPVPEHMKPGRIGQIMGKVTDSASKPVVDAWVTINGRNYTYLTSGDGFFGIPNVPPGNYTLAISTDGGKEIKRPVVVTADKTTPADLRLP